MKPIRYAPAPEVNSVSVMVRATGALVTVCETGYETSCPHEQEALDALELVQRQAAAKRGKTQEASQ